MPNQVPVKKIPEPKEGIFVLVKHTDHDAYYTFRFADARQKLLGEDYLLVFNEIMAANEALVDMANQDASADHSKDLILYVENQARWTDIVETMAEQEVTEGIINVCNHNDHHCPTTPFNLEEYRDFHKLTELLKQHPRNHYVLV